ncbi:thioredoxin [Planctomicrobium sp. SH661]|uniref:thioredoxin n=1 Tax=Planctomicrobium sp. SH661 TaxID=3448124 RepID=UPI003F5AFA9F
MAGNLQEFSDATFQDDVLSSDQPVLVDFWAPWCGPCKMLTPTIEALAEKYVGKVKVGKLNTDDNRQAAINYQINSIPTLIVFKGGKPVDRILGLQPQDRIAALLDKHIG